MILIIGASGFIGRHLYNYFSQKNNLLAGTHHRTSYKNTIPFDLEISSLNELDIDLSKISHAIICSAISKPDECKKHEKETYKINVEGTKKLLEQLWQRKIFPIWFSSEYVFNGESGDYSEQDKPCPNTVYGGHKAIIEDFLNQSRKEFLILRLGKVFSLIPEDRTILTSTFQQLKNNEIIKCATDQIFSPLYIQDLAKIIDIAIEKNLEGLYNTASPESFSRFQLTNLIKEKLNIETGKVIPCSIKDFQFADNRPLNTSLNVDKIIRDANFQFTSIEQYIQKLNKI